jgi:D-alanyl-lipoteichoic acid acyltransferase DltB (MBOAT superfamily)
LFKKFVIANALGWISLNNVFAQEITSSLSLWILLYCYSLQIYFDFSGYTDMAIGLGRFLGVRLPENFASPYLKPNLTQFWNSWHMTLTQWFRSYFFNPLTRALRSSNLAFASYTIIFLTQISTMVTIGLWHGITLNFVFWGLWHGIGLFIQNRWSDFMRGRSAMDRASPLAQRLVQYVNIFLTFNYVSLGWLFFMLPTPAIAWQTMMKLVGLT